MNRAFAVLAMAAMVASAGCSKKDEPERPEDYAGAPDAAPACSALVAHRDAPDEGLMADQTKATGGRTVVAWVDPATAGNVPIPAAGAAGADAAIAAVKSRVAAAIAALKANDSDRACDELFASDVRGAMKKITALEQTQADFEKLVQSKFGVGAGDWMKQAAGGTGPQQFGGDRWKTASVDQFKFAYGNGKVTVTDPEGKPETFVRTAEGWRTEVPAEAKPMLGLAVEVAEAQRKVIGILTAEINAGKVTREALPARAKELGEQHVKPVVAKLFGEMMKAMGAASSTSTAPATGF